MNKFPYALMAALWAAGAQASPPRAVVQSCLKTQAVSRAVSYVDLVPASFNVADDRNGSSKTFRFQHKAVGLWERSGSGQFGLVYGHSKIPAKRVSRIGPLAPAPFDPYTAQWGVSHFGKQAYLCITFNFAGLGESGSFQNTRGLYLIDTRAAVPRAYYTVGDIRNVDAVPEK